MGKLRLSVLALIAQLGEQVRGERQASGGSLSGGYPAGYWGCFHIEIDSAVCSGGGGRIARR